MIGEKITDLMMQRILDVQSGGVKLLNKLDYIMMPASAWATFLQQVGQQCGGEDCLFELGHEAGEIGAKDIIEKVGFQNKIIPGKFKIIMTMFKVLGFGTPEFKKFDASTNRMIIHLTKHPVIEAAKLKYGGASMVCAHYRGIFSIHGELELGLGSAHFVETQCRCKGADFCEWMTGYELKNK